MTPEHYIHRLLQKYQKYPGFPFDDWVQNAGSFYALINIWDEIFSVAAGEAKEKYKALGDAKQHPDSYIYQVCNSASRKKIRVTYSEYGGTFHVLSNVVDPGRENMNKYELGFVVDLERNRLVSCFNMIRYYVSNSIEGESDREDMDNFFIDSYGEYFGFEDYNPFNSPLFPITEFEAEDDDEEC